MVGGYFTKPREPQMNISQGRLLTPQESARLTVLDKPASQRLIEAIAAKLCEAGKANAKGRQHNTPKRWYAKMRTK